MEQHELLRTKLMPPRVPSALVPRPGLVARLDGWPARKLTLISAPAGFGKTTLVSQWLATVNAPAAWVSLDANDNDPVRFWLYTITACRGFGAELGKPALAALRMSQQPPLEAVLTTFINDLADLDQPCVLALEDFHTIVASEIFESMAFLLEHLPATLHLVLLTRSEPPLPLARLRARSELLEIGTRELRFTPEESRSFVRQALPTSLLPEALDHLVEQAEGWAAGLRLMTLALRGQAEPGKAPWTPQSGRPVAGEQRYVTEYLVEVLATLPESTQSFLLETSFLQPLTATLCDAVTGRDDSAFILQRLERDNVFLIPLTGRGDRPWYRYHGLFAEAMRFYTRERLGEARMCALQEKASLWYESHGLLDAAVEAALAAQQFERAAALLDQQLEAQRLNGPHTLVRQAGQIPEQVLWSFPSLCFHVAMAILFASDRFRPETAAQVEVPLRKAEDAWRLRKNNARLGQVLALRAIIMLWQGDYPRSFAYSHQALELLAEHDAMWRGINLNNLGLEELLAGRINSAQGLILQARALSEAARNVHARLVALHMLGETYAWQADLDQAGYYYRLVLADAAGGDEMLDDQALALLGLAGIAYERDDLNEAEMHAARALDLARRRGDEERVVQASLLLARVEQARNLGEQARLRLDSLAAQVRRPASLRDVQAWQARLALAAGDLERAKRWQINQAPSGTPLTFAQEEREALIVARLYLAQEDPGAALDLLDGRQSAAREQGRVRSEIEILCLQALADPGQTEQNIVQALGLAQRGPLRRVFLDEGEPMAALLHAVAQRLGRRSPADYAAALLRASWPGQARRAGSLAPGILPSLEPLSPQERRVLRLLAAGLSNPEIAEELVVSVNTVKTQVSSIYRKLDVHSRDQAREVAHELTLL